MELLDLQKHIIYGPVNSRRLGRSVGLNLLPADFKVCSMNCCYCQYGWTSRLSDSGLPFAPFLPSAVQVSEAVRDFLRRDIAFDFLTFSGNGEPTLHPEFPTIVENILQLREELKCSFKLALLSNSTTCNRAGISSVLNKIDVPMMKLDSGNAQTFQAMNHAHREIDYQDIVTGLKRLKRFVVQTMFVQGAVDNTGDADITDWIKMLKKFQPMWVQIYSLDRGAANRELVKVSATRLREIARRVQEDTKLTTEVY